MFFDNWHDLLVMDGHGAYVWAAYLVTFLVILAALALPARRCRRLLLQLGAEQKQVPGGSGTREEP